LLCIGVVTYCRIASFASLLLLAPISSAYSQTGGRFAFGGEFKIKTSDRASNEDYAEGQLGPGFLWRFGHTRPGWGFHWGLNWYAVKIQRPVGGAAIELGELHVRPLMGGYGYNWAIRRYSITADVLGGYAAGSMSLDAPAVDAYRRALGVSGATATASNTFVVKPEVGVWYDVNRRIGVNVNAGYMIARPDVTVATASGADFRTARADQFILKAGVVYSIF
jgi:hypothetical protein